MPAAVEALLRRDRVTVGAALAILAALAWLYLVGMARHMADMATPTTRETPHMQPWGAADVAMLVAMWAVMMVGMILHLLCVAALSLFVLVEKAAPAGPWIARAAGVPFAAAGVAMMVA